jgi:glyoxylase-like metal-dependent hydrolase (beta-lactamase superfamily II)
VLIARSDADFTLGAASILRVEESAFDVLDPFELYPHASEQQMAADLDWLAPRFYDPRSRRLVLAFQGFVLRSAGVTILIDTCVGDCKERRRASFHRQQWGWLGRLRAAGIAPESVDYVVCTHFHVDHVGWNTRLQEGRWVPSFPRARYLFPREELAYWTGPAGQRALERTGDYLADSVTPILEHGLADLVSPDHRINAEVRLRPAPGHTPGSVLVELDSAGERALFLGDVLHTLLQVRYPDWSTRFCTDPDQARGTRLALLEEAARTGTIVVPNHFVSPTLGRIERDRSGYTYRYAGAPAPVFPAAGAR